MRLEIIANRVVEEDILGAVRLASATGYYTQIPVVHGVGSSEPRLGSPVWPEENLLLIVYCGEQEAERLIAAVAEVKRRFPGEGIKLYAIREAVEIELR